LSATSSLVPCPTENSNPGLYQQQAFTVLQPASVSPPGYCPPTTSATTGLCPARAFMPMSLVKTYKSPVGFVYQIKTFDPAPQNIGQYVLVYLESTYNNSWYGLRFDVMFQFPDVVIADARTRYNNPTMTHRQLVDTIAYYLNAASNAYRISSSPNLGYGYEIALASSKSLSAPNSTISGTAFFSVMGSDMSVGAFSLAFVSPIQL
jgi:hypothetical protein